MPCALHRQISYDAGKGLFGGFFHPDIDETVPARWVVAVAVGVGIQHGCPAARHWSAPRWDTTPLMVPTLPSIISSSAKAVVSQVHRLIGPSGFCKWSRVGISAEVCRRKGLQKHRCPQPVQKRYSRAPHRPARGCNRQSSGSKGLPTWTLQMYSAIFLIFSSWNRGERPPAQCWIKFQNQPHSSARRGGNTAHPRCSSRPRRSPSKAVETVRCLFDGSLSLLLRGGQQNDRGSILVHQLVQLHIGSSPLPIHRSDV